MTRPRAYSYFGRHDLAPREAGRTETHRRTGPLAAVGQTPEAGGPPPLVASGVDHFPASRGGGSVPLTLALSPAAVLTLRLCAAEAGCSEAELLSRLIGRHAAAIGIAGLADVAERRRG